MCDGEEEEEEEEERCLCVMGRRRRRRRRDACVMVMCDSEEEERCLCGMTMTQLHVHITAPFFLSSLPSLSSSSSSLPSLSSSSSLPLAGVGHTGLPGVRSSSCHARDSYKTWWGPPEHKAANTEHFDRGRCSGYVLG